MNPLSQVVHLPSLRVLDGEFVFSACDVCSVFFGDA